MYDISYFRQFHKNDFRNHGKYVNNMATVKTFDVTAGVYIFNLISFALLSFSRIKLSDDNLQKIHVLPSQTNKVVN